MIFLSSCSMLIQGYIFSSVPSVYDARAGLYDSCFICLFHTRVWVWMVEEVTITLTLTLTLTHTLRYFEYSEFYFSEFKNLEVINFRDFVFGISNFRDFSFSRFFFRDYETLPKFAEILVINVILPFVLVLLKS